MVIFLLAIVGAPGFGALYPAATLDGAVKQERCMISYRFTTSAPIDKVAAFYRAEGAGAGVALLDDSGTKFADCRLITFVRQPRFLNVALDVEKGWTVGRIAFHTRAC